MSNLKRGILFAHHNAGTKYGEVQTIYYTLSARLSKEQYHQVLQRANGMQLSSFTRLAVLDQKPIKSKGLVIINPEPFAQGLALLGSSRLHSNANQIALHMNSGTYFFTKEAETAICEIGADVRCMKHLFMRGLSHGDTLMVYKLDRLGRNMLELLKLQQQLNKLNVTLKSLSQNIDTTTTAGGQLIFAFFTALSEHESNINGERTKGGMAIQKAKGVCIGRPPKLLEEDIKKVNELHIIIDIIALSLYLIVELELFEILF